MSDGWQFKVGWSLILVGVGVALSGPAMEASEFGHGAWPFNRLVPAKPPELKQPTESLSNPVDAFVVAELQSLGLRLNAPADRLTVLRRVTYDLTGLPPTAAEQEAFLADPSPSAYTQVVERLLSSPAYGERWAQHWLDVVRYAETEGFKADKLRPNAYRYRDYVIQSLNMDRPYSEFVQQQLAGDQLWPDDPDALIASGLNRLYPDEDNAANLFQRRQEILNDLTETTGLAFMGLTMGCAQCHDHKFDDILQADFYRLQAFFSPMIERDDVPAVSADAAAEHAQRHKVWDEATRDIRRQMDALVAEERESANAYHLTKFRAEIQEAYLKQPAARSPLEEQIAQMVARQLAWRFDPNKAAKSLPASQKERYLQLQAALEDFDHLKPEPLPKAMAVGEVQGGTPPTYLLDGGNFQRPLDEVTPGFPVFLTAKVTPQTSGPEASAKAPRAELAEWLTQGDHPLTARVIVNRLWHYHLGRGIVPTPNDFGNMGGYVTHPKLLDWLATELVTHDWSLKHIHRLILSSTTYRQSADVDPTAAHHAMALKLDPENDLLWHARRRRLEGESIRDAMLFVSGQLNGRMLGTSSHPPLPPGISPRYAWKADERESDHSRRSVYVLAKRNMRYPLFDVFDLPDMHSSCAHRTTTTNAPQALLMLNSRLTHQSAEHWAAQLDERHGEDHVSLIRDAYTAAFGRLPDAEELGFGLEFLGHARPNGLEPDGVTESEVLGVVDFCHALLNSNEFIYLD